jgi:trans-aconitate methyltransferase
VNPGAEHWQHVHTSKAVDDVSWWQEHDQLWMDLVEELDLPHSAAVLDVGAGSSLLVDALVQAGFRDITALDIAPAALERVRTRLGGAVRLVVADVLEYTPEAPVDLWHDRAVFHFLTEAADRQRYRDALHAALSAGGVAIVATFAPDGPQQCSGLPVRRYTPEQIASEIGLRPVRVQRRAHTTPWGGTQPFSVAVLAR